jgi:hypothetical protein
MSIEDNHNDRIKHSCEIFTLLPILEKNQNEIADKLECLQRAVAASCRFQADFKAEYEEYMAELKRRIWELRWISKEGVS